MLPTDIPELSVSQEFFVGHWVGSVLGSYLDNSHLGKAIVSNFIRHVEAARDHYRSGRSAALRYFDAHSNQLPISEYIIACTRFEDCVDHAYRAIESMEAIVRRRTIVPQGIRDLFSTKPNFLRGPENKAIRTMRRLIHHTYERIQKAEMPSDTPFMIGIVTGEHPKVVPAATYDRLRIGDAQLSFSGFVRQLDEMAECAERIANYSP